MDAAGQLAAVTQQVQAELAAHQKMASEYKQRQHTWEQERAKFEQECRHGSKIRLSCGMRQQQQSRHGRRWRLSWRLASIVMKS